MILALLTVCPRSSYPFDIVYKLLYKMGHYFIDIQYVILTLFNTKIVKEDRDSRMPTSQ